MITISADALAHAVKIASRVGDRVWLTTREGSLTVRSVAPGFEVSISVPCESGQQPPMLLEAKALHRAASKLEGSLTLSQDKSRVVVRSGKRRTEIDCYEYDDPQLLSVPDHSRTVDVSALRTAIERTESAASKDVTRAYLCCVRLILENGVSAVATDGRRLHLCGSAREEGASALSLPAPLAAVLDDLLPKSGSVSIRADAHVVRVEGEGWHAAHAAVAGVFPSYARVIPSGRSREAYVSREALASELSVLLALGARRALLELGELLRVTTSDPPSECAVEARMQGESPGAVALDLRYLCDAVGAMRDDEIVLALSGGVLDPVVVEDRAGMAVVMPVREMNARVQAAR